MKQMTCNQLGGACEETFQAASFQEMAQLSKQHAMKMIEAKDTAHLEAMHKMQKLMEEPEKMAKWFSDKENEFNSLPSLKNY